MSRFAGSFGAKRPWARRVLVSSNLPRWPHAGSTLGAAGLGLAMGLGGCGTDASLEPGAAGVDLRPSSGETEPRTPSDAGAPEPGETDADEPTFWLVPEARAVAEITQVYNGATHDISDVSAILRADSEEVAVYVQNELGSLVTDAQLERFMTRLLERGTATSYLPQTGILATNESVFGVLERAALPMGQQRIFVVDTAGAGDGYLCGWCTHPDLHLDGPSVAPIDGEHALSISAHELYHAIHRGYDPDEEVWLDESMAEAAMTVNGYFTDEAWLSDYLRNANRDWGPSGADVTTVHYGACLAWGTYLWEQGGPELMKAITREPANGWTGLDAALARVGETRTSWELFVELGAALYYDDSARGYGIDAFDLPTRLRVTPLSSDVDTALEPYGFLHFEVNVGTKFTVRGQGVTAAYVSDAPRLALEHLELGQQFNALQPGVLILTARTQAVVSLRVE